MIRAIALDDEPLSLELIEAFCGLNSDIELVKKFHSPYEALKYMRNFPVDVIFLDIDMPNFSGIKLASNIGKDIKIIFSTAHAQYAVESYNLEAVDYLLKPFEYERFEKAIDRLKAAMEVSGTNSYIYVRFDYKLAKIRTDDILLIESLGDYLTLRLKDGSSVTARLTMNEIMTKLPPKEFVRVHRSFILPCWRVSIIRDKKIVLEDGEIPVGIRYEKNVKEMFKG